MVILVGVVREKLHERWSMRVCDLVDGLLEPEEQTPVRDHLVGCVRCRGLLGDLAHLDALAKVREH